VNRTGLIVALAVAALTGLVFGLFPQLDIALSEPFFDPVKKKFALRFLPWLGFLRDAAMWVVMLLIAPAIVALIVKFIWPRRPLIMSGRAIVFLIASLALAPGVLVNVILKEHWGRVRPIDLAQFEGVDRFTAWWDPRGHCPANCSFVAGEGSGAFWTMAPAALAPPAWRPLAYAGAVAFGLAVGGLRIVFGAHFPSDVLFAGVFTFLVIWVVHGLIYRWPRTRTTDDAIDSALERAFLRWHGFVRGLFGKRPRPSDP